MKTFRMMGPALMAVLTMAVLAACDSDDDYGVNAADHITLKTAGTLRLTLGNYAQTISSLKVSGPINGDDVICLRQMLRCTDEESSTRGMLTTLDLSDASIVWGGDAYYAQGDAAYSTANDIVGDYMFHNCESLEEMALPDDATAIGDYAFFECKRLTWISIGSDVHDIGSNAFYGCEGLTEMSLPNSVTNVGDDAFAMCYGLESVTIGSNVKEIGDRAFAYCTGLKKVTSLRVMPPNVTSTTFEGVDRNSCTLYVTKGAKDAYANATGWQDFRSISEI